MNTIPRYELEAFHHSNSLKKMFFFQFQNLRARFENAPAQHQLPPCKDFKEKILNCYKQNPNEPLNCASVVADFSNCVQDHRTNLLKEKYSKKNEKTAPKLVAAAS